MGSCGEGLTLLIKLARLTSAAGYKDARSLAAKLYKLAARYPAAAHFRWRS